VLVPVILAFAAATQTPPTTAPAPANPRVEQTDDADSRLLDTAFGFIQRKQPDQSIPILDGIISRAEARYARETRVIYTSRSLAETVYYGGLAAAAKKSAVILDETWSMALFLKAFALIDLNRPDEAKPLLDRAIAMAPMNSHYLGERGEWFKTRRDWTRAYADFSAAANAADLSPDDMKSFDKRRAWRGMAYVRIEQGQLDDAERLLRQALQLDPNDAGAKQELDYIRSVRSKK